MINRQLFIELKPSKKLNRMKINLRTKLVFFTFLTLGLVYQATAQTVTITVNAAQDKKAISPYIYGRNESFDKPVQFYKDAGLRFARVGGGNNMSAYNWRLKLTVHPDWYNNVYGSDWDVPAQKINDNFPNMQGMFAFQLLGRAASSNKYNFNDWAYNNSQYWSGVGQNLAGGGTPNPAGGSNALVDGDINLFSKPWPADSSVAILTHWFGAEGKGLNKQQFQYWDMDNEADVWNGTHNWAMPTLISASAFMDRYIDLAKKAKAIYPGIKLCGPVGTSEWQWFKWSDESIYVNGKYYCWLEYFIKRCADEEKASGVRVLDVLDLHNYPYYTTDAEALQLHREYYDKTYDYPGANGLKSINGGWDNSQTKEYIFVRINDWLTTYFGTNHKIGLGISEWSPGPSDPNYASVIYASHLGLFGNNGVELFSPWTWFNGMWETLHLFSRYAKPYSVSSVSSLENTVSAYTSITERADSMTIILVNRNASSAQSVNINLTNFTVENGSYTTLQLSSLPTTETFKSHADNALKSGTVSVNSNALSISLPKLSTTAVILKAVTTGLKSSINQQDEIKIYPNPASDFIEISLGRQTNEAVQVSIFDNLGKELKTMNVKEPNSPFRVNVANFPKGFYWVKVKNKQLVSTKGFVIN
jgi:hypothetical protein